MWSYNTNNQALVLKSLLKYPNALNINAEKVLTFVQHVLGKFNLNHLGALHTNLYRYFQPKGFTNLKAIWDNEPLSQARSDINIEHFNYEQYANKPAICLCA